MNNGIVEKTKSFINDRYEKDPLFTVFIGVSIALLLVFIICGIITRGDTVSGMFCERPGDYFEDFFYSVVASSDRPYNFQHVIYPPLITVIFAVIGYFVLPFANVPPGDAMDTYYFLRDTQAGMMTYFIFVIALILLIWMLVADRYNDKKTRWILFFFIISYPVLFSIERGNCIPLVLYTTLFFVFFYRSESKWLRYLSYVSLAVAVGIKIYPIALIFLIIRDKRYKEALLCLVIVAVLFLLPFIFTDGDPMVLLDNMRLHSDHRMGITTGLTGVHLYLTPLLQGFMSETAISILCYIIAAILAVVFILIVIKDEKMEYWKILMLCVCAMLFGPSIAATEYMLVFTLIPALYFFNSDNEKSKENLFFAILFAVVFALIPGISLFGYDPQPFPIAIKKIFMAAATFLLLIEGAMHLKKMKEEKIKACDRT